MEIERIKALEDRLVMFAVKVSGLASSLPSDVAGKYLAAQIIRSGYSPALNYGEAQSAESVNDFIHKMKIALKELRETHISLKILKQSNIHNEETIVDCCIQECNELISIFVKSIQTAEKNKNLKKR